MQMLLTELIGLIGSVGVMISMFFNTDTAKGTLLLRHINNIGSVFFIWYGIRLQAVSTILLNAVVIVINVYHIWKIHKQQRATKDK